MEGTKVMFALLLLVALCAVVAIIISAVTLSRPSSVPTITLNGLGGGQSRPIVVGGGSSGGSRGESDAGRVYTIAIGHDWGGHQYLDEKNFIQGFSKEFILEVCEHAGIDCRIVWDSYPNCWRSVPGDHSMGGVGLFSGWYDACADWVGTPGRVQVFDFALPYLIQSPIYFFKKRGKSFDPQNIEGKTLGFMNGWSADEKCIARQENIKGNVPSKYKFIYYDLTKNLGAAISNDSVDAGFTGSETLSQYMIEHPDHQIVQIKEPFFECAIHGNSIMTRKDNTLIPLWNAGFKKMKESGRFQQLCAEAEKKHGHRGVLLKCAL